MYVVWRSIESGASRGRVLKGAMTRERRDLLKLKIGEGREKAQ